MGRRHRLRGGVHEDLGGEVTVAPSVIEATSLTKFFGATRALNDVTFRVAPGEIHALIGLNGSGKSTLVKTLAGIYHPDGGELEHGKLAVVHQDLGLLPTLSIVENFIVGRPTATRFGMIDWRVERDRASAALQAFDMECDLDTRIDSLSAAERVTIAVARAIDRAEDDVVSAIVLDEPTSALPAHETTLLADAIRRFASVGLGVVLVTHRLQEVVDLAHSVTVLRDGRVVTTGPLAGRTSKDLADLMVGDVQTGPEDIEPESESPGDHEPCELRMAGVTHGPLRQFDLTVQAGQITGVFGVHGSGADELAALLSGRTQPDAGSVTLESSTLARLFATSTDVAYVPSDRPQRGILPTLSVADNIALVGLEAMKKGMGISSAAVRSTAWRWIGELGIKTTSEMTPIARLSGGNQQKAILARWLQVDPRVIVAEEPTQGIDVWAKQDILRNLRLAARRNAIVVLCAGEPEEILEFCDRVIVVNRGELVFDQPRSSTSTAELLSAMH